MKPFPLYRNLVLCGEITSSTINTIINKIMDINYDDDLKCDEYRDWEREPIYLFISSCGGDAYDAMALYDVVKQSKTPVYTVALGQCMSAALWIFTAGARRITGENATFMFHDVKTWVNDKSAGLQQELKESLRLSQKYCDAITSVSTIGQDELDHFIATKGEWYIPAEEAIKRKLADKYYK